MLDGARFMEGGAAISIALPSMVDDDDDGEAIDGDVLAEVLLAKKPSMSYYIVISLVC
jgi:hypothetical protein